MYAVFEDGSRQYLVCEGDVIDLDHRDLEVGARLELSQVLMYRSAQETKIGQPIVAGARILAEVVGHPSEKVYVQKFRRRKNYRRLRGHRQPYISVQIRSILLPGMEQAPAPASTPAKKDE